MNTLSAKKIKQPLPRTVYRHDAQIYKILANPKRLEILNLLGEQEMSCEELLRILGIPKANMSQHLALLRDANLVTVRREGLKAYYNIVDPNIITPSNILHQIRAEHKY